MALQIDRICELTGLQGGILFHSSKEHSGCAYHQQLYLRFRGMLDVLRLGDAWRGVISRHSVLRTSFVWEELTRPVQVVRRTVPFDIAVEDWCDVPVESRQEKLEQYLESDRTKGFDLHSAPLLRVAVICVDEDAQVLVLSFHHIIMDGWSLAIVLDEVFRAYGGEEFSGNGEPPPQFSDYIEWYQRGSRAAGQEEFWRSYLSDFREATRLELACSKGNSTLGESAWLEVRLSSQQTEALREFVRRERLTLSTLFQGAWAVVLSRHSGCQDVIFGLTVSGRTADVARIELIVGLLINTIPVRIKVDPQIGVQEWLGSLQQMHAELKAFENTPLVDIQSWSEIPAGTPLFDSLLVFENYPIDESLDRRLRDLQLLQIGGYERTNYPLVLTVIPGDEIRLRITYETSRFDREGIGAIAERLERVVSALASGRYEFLGNVPLLSEAEQQKLIREWNATEAEYPADQCIHELFQAQVERTPEATALECGAQTLSYWELNLRANQLAHFLRGRGVGPEALVGVCLDRSIEMVVAVLGVLKAGGAYVPLDPSYPQARLAHMIENAALRLVIADADSTRMLPCDSVEVADLTTLSDTLAACPVANPVNHTDPDNLAYVIYTSGSTGQPKGVMVPHRGVVNVVCFFLFRLRLIDSSRVISLTNLGFDIAALELFMPLFVGSCIVIVDDYPWQPTAVTIVQGTPSRLALLESSGIDINRAAWLLVGGESISEGFARARTNRMMFVYGPTETTVWSSLVTIKESSAVSIGRPIGNTQVYVVDESGALVPEGVTGELWIGGVGVTRGYNRSASLTAARFIPDPFSGRKGSRLYRSGDLVRYRSDGLLEFVGRLDHQIKLRGYRIELGEIEAVLAQHDAVVTVAVVVRGRGNDKCLVAYVQVLGNSSLDELRCFAARQLPAYMVPAAFIALDKFPLSPNGKLDRAALPEVQWMHSVGVSGRDLFSTHVAGIFADVLKLPYVGEESFFELGGHSLRAIQLSARVQAQFGINCPINAVFSHPTVKEFSIYIAQQLRTGAGLRELPSPERSERRGEYPLSYAQERLWFLSELEPESVAYNVVAAVKLIGLLDARALKQSLDEVARRHEVLRTVVAVQEGGIPVQRVRGEVGSVLLEVRAEGDVQARRAAAMRRVRESAGERFDLRQGPLFRAELIRIDEEEQLLIVAMHHIVCDGWSMDVLVSEIGSLYRSYAKGEESHLGELKVQYGDYAVWQREWLRDEALEEQLRYWKAQLVEVEVLNLPADRIRPALPSYEGGEVEFEISEALTAKLEGLSRREGVTVFMTLLAAFQVLLWRYSGQHDVAVGSPVANRDRIETEGLIGFFVNTVVFRSQLRADERFRDLLGRVRETALDAYTYQHAPFEKVVEALQPERSLSWTPLFQVMFVFQHEPRASRSLGEVEVQPVRVESGTAKFDLTLEVQQTGKTLKGTLEYSRDLFDEQRIRAMAQHWLQLLEGIAKNPDATIDVLPLLSEAEQQKLIREWNATEAEYPADQCIHELFQAQVERTPEATALECGAQTLSYWELNLRANQLAHFLRGRGVGPEALVGVCLDRSIEMVVAVLGVLKAGGAYVPLDPSYPQARLAHMIENAALRLVIADADSTRMLPCDSVEVADLTTLSDTLAACPVANPVNHTDPDNLAYVIYTSGSTGQPKGVMVQVGSVLNHAKSFASRLKIGNLERVLAFGSPAVDVFGEQIYPSLLVGAVIVLFDRRGGANVETLNELISDRKISVANLPASVWESWASWLSRGARDLPRELRVVITGSDTCAVSSWKDWLVRYPSVELVNAYGTTETTITNATFSSFCDRPGNAHRIPIGKILSNATGYVADVCGNPQPANVTGELYLSGHAVARGYLGDPSLTAEKFRPSRFGPPGRRVYVTGDSVRLESGDLTFLGRIDHQIKIDGFRVEPAEVQTTIARLSHSEQVEVIRIDSSDRSSHLIALFVPSTTSPTAEIIMKRLRDILPYFMVPARVVAVTSIPRSPAGKVDAVAAARLAISAIEELYSDPGMSPREKEIAEIWASVLQRSDILPDHNFFELGGDSIQSTRVVAEAERRGIRLTVRQMFEAADLRRLARISVDALHRQPSPANGVHSPAPLMPAQEWFFRENDGNYNSASYIIGATVEAKLNAAEWHSVIEALVYSHPALRHSFGRQLGVWSQIYVGYDPATSIWCEGYDEDEERECIERSRQSLDITTGDVARFIYFGAPEGRGKAVVLIHHLVADQVSLQMLGLDLGVAIEAINRGQHIEVDAEAYSYAQCSRAVAADANSFSNLQALEHWKRVLDVPHGRLKLSSQGNITGKNRLVRIHESMWKPLLGSGNKRMKALEASLIAALRYALGDDVAGYVQIDTEGHGRDVLGFDVDLSRTVGWFTSVSPLMLPPLGHLYQVFNAVAGEILAPSVNRCTYGILRYLSTIPSAFELAERPKSQFLFNFLGTVSQSPFIHRGLVMDDRDYSRDHAVAGHYLAEVNSWIDGDWLMVDWRTVAAASASLPMWGSPIQ